MFDKVSLGQLLTKNWTLFLSHREFLRLVENDALNSAFETVKTKDVPRPKTGVTITKFEPFDKLVFEIWAEFTITRGKVVIVGTHIYHLGLDGKLTLQKTLARGFEPES